MTEPFYKLEKKRIESVKIGRITVEDFGVLCGFACLVNPYNGYWLGNFSLLGSELGITANKAKYICEKLKKLDWLYFSTQQGKRRKIHFFVLGLAMVTNKGGPSKTVTHDYIRKTLEDSEVDNAFQKSKHSKLRQESSAASND